MRTKTEKRSERVVLHVTPTLRKRLERLARAEKRSIAAMARVLIEDGLSLVGQAGRAGR